MHDMIPGRRRLLAALAAGGLGAVAGGARADAAVDPAFDPGVTPAAPYRLIRSAVYTGVAVAGSRLVCVGERGFVLLSDDDGRTWAQVDAVPVSVALTSVCFATPSLGWATGHGGVVLATRDGGRHWSRVLDGRRAAAIELAAAQAAGDPVRLRNAERLVHDGPDKPFLDVAFDDAQRGMVVGAYGLAFRTSDGGRSWESVIGDIDNPQGHHLYDICPTAQGRCITGEQGTLLRETGGRFAGVDVGYRGTLFGGVATRDGALLVFGLRGNAFRRAGGAGPGGWTRVDFGQPLTLTAGIVLRDGGVAVVDETGRFMLSRDGGATFRALDGVKMEAATGLAQTPSGTVIVSTQRGPVRIATEILGSPSTS